MELDELTDKAIDYIIEELATDLRAGRSKLNDWEANFIISVSDRWERDRILSEKQKETLGRIWDKY